MAIGCAKPLCPRVQCVLSLSFRARIKSPKEVSGGVCKEDSSHFQNYHFSHHSHFNQIFIMATFIEAEAGPSTIPEQNGTKLYERLTQSSANRRTYEDDDERNSDEADDDELFDELERELEEEDERGSGVMGRLREERMEQLRNQ